MSEQHWRRVTSVPARPPPHRPLALAYPPSRASPQSTYSCGPTAAVCGDAEPVYLYGPRCYGGDTVAHARLAVARYCRSLHLERDRRSRLLPAGCRRSEERRVGEECDSQSDQE